MSLRPRKSQHEAGKGLAWPDPGLVFTYPGLAWSVENIPAQDGALLLCSGCRDSTWGKYYLLLEEKIVFFKGGGVEG